MKAHLAIYRTLFAASLLAAASGNAADLVWIGGTPNWNVAASWSPAQVPSSADNAWITNNGTYTVTVPAGSTAAAASLVIGGASGAQTLAIDRATLTLNGASVVSTNGTVGFLVAQSVLNGSGNLTVNGLLDWANGTISGTGTLSINSGGALAIGSGGVTLGRTLNNSGSVTWAGGNLSITAGNSINNLAGATIDITADGRLSGAASTPINNSGLFRQTAGTTGTIVTAPVNNSGNLQVLASTLNLNLGGTHSGTFSNAPGATVNFGGGNHVLASSSLVTGAGTLNMSGATTLAASGTFDTGATLSVSGGVATLAAGCNVTGATLNIGGGIVSYNSSGPVGKVNLSSGTLGGTSPIAVTGPLSLSGGSVTNGLVIGNGGISISGNVTLNGARLVNPANALWSAGNIVGANGAAISNLLGATFINSFDGNANTGSGTTPLFINAGIFQKTNGTAAAGTTSIDFQFVNTGTVEVRTNTLRYNVNQQTSGLTLLDGGALSAQAQPIQLLGGSLVGTGLVTVANTMNVINSSAISPGFPVGELDIAGNYQQTASGVLNIDLGGYTPGTGFDLVTVAAGGAGGVATVGGTLNVTLTNGFSPTNGASFTFLTASSRVGAFATFNYPSNEIGMQLSLDAASATIKVTNLKPVVANPIADPAAGTYGSAFSFQFPANTFSDPDNNTLTYSATGLPPGISFTSATRTFSGTPTQAGVFPVAVAATDNGSPSLTVTDTFTISINPAPLAIAAQPQTKTYGSVDPALTFTATGLQFADTVATVLSGGLARAAGDSVAGGPYAISQGTLAANSNYAISFTGTTLTVTPATLTITAQPQLKTYAAADPALTFTVSGLQFSDTAAGVLTGGLARVAGESVTGSPYAITRGSLAANGNYSISFAGSTLTITAAGLTVTASARSKTYGTTLTLNGAADFTSSGLLNAETIGSVTLTASGSPAGTAANAPVGSYTITPSAATGGTFTPANYAITYATGSLAVNKAGLSVTADAKTKNYGAADPTFTATDSGFVNGETAAALGGTLAFNRAPGENVGGYLITPSGLTSSNYNITFNTGTLSITQATLTVTADTKTKTYGAADPALTFTVSGLQFADTQASVLTGALARAAGESVAGSPYAINQGTLAANGNYTISFTGSTLTITKAALAVTADAQTKVYGAADPAFTVTYSGFVNGETPAVLGGTLSFVRAPGENVGGYQITPSGLTSGNYAITFNPGTLSITRATLIITAQAKTKSYGAADPALTFTVSGLQFADTQASVLTGALTRVAGETVAGSPYAITQGTLAANGNYSISFTGNALAITPATLAITAQAKTKSYGATDPALTFTVNGFQFTDTQASVMSGTLTRAAGETVAGSPYAITQGTLAANGNYSISFTGNTLAITPATLTITAQTKTKSYGATDPALTFTVSGLQFTDTQASVLTGALTRAAGETVAGSPYAITQGTLAANGNYSISFTGSTLAITPATLTITAQAKTKSYGAADPALTFTVSGLQFTDTQASVLTGALTRAAGETVAGSPYAITQGTLAANGNYSISFTGSTLAITPATLTITAQAKTKSYGAADPALTFTVSGLQFTDTQASVLTGALTRAAGETVAGSPYAITQGTLAANGNYSISFTGSTLAITPATLTITAQAKTKTYGAADPALTFTVSGLQFTDTQASVLTGALTRAVGETVAGSPYAITQGTLAANGNYSISFTGSALAITPATLTITAQTKTKSYGAADPALTFTVSGLQFTDTQASVLTGALTRAAGETVAGSPYAISQGTLAANGNYSISFTGSALAISKAALSVTADAKTKIFGAADPAFTVTYSGFVNGETPAVLGSTLSFVRAPGENVGSYLITPSGLTSGNYAITFNTGTLTITAPAPLMLPIARAGTNVVITWTSVSNANYRVQYKTVLSAATWTDLAGDVSATGSIASKTDPMTTTNHFYRVQVLP